MENKKNILEELEKEAPFLSKIKKENNEKYIPREPRRFFFHFSKKFSKNY